MELIQEMRNAGFFRTWGALVTNDFFYKEENLELVHKAGCLGIFSGIEAFDTEWLQNNQGPEYSIPTGRTHPQKPGCRSCISLWPHYGRYQPSNC